PRIARIWFRPYPNFGAALIGFKEGEVHGLGHIPTDRVAEVQQVPGAQIHRQTLARYSLLILNTQSPLLDKPQTRQAIEFAIDRKSLISQALQGQAALAYSPVLSQSWAYNPSTPHREHDPAEARRLLDAAGWVMGPTGVRARQGVTLTLVLAANKEAPANVAVAQQIAGQLREVGIDSKLALVSRDTLLRDYLAPRAFHIVLASWEAQGGDPDVQDYWHSPRPGGGGLNFSGWSNTQADRSLETALLTLDVGSRATEYATFQDTFAQDVPGVILYDPVYTYATRPPAGGARVPTTDLLNPAYRFDTIGNWYLK
ncbi:MAG: ABC transporter substrate-binding protein, partial [Chloroflexia bacterium]